MPLSTLYRQAGWCFRPLHPWWRCAPLGLVLALVGTCSAANPSLRLIVSNETIPAGATGQVKVWAASPTPIASGAFNIYFDPSVFSGIAGFGAFSANGDVSARATIEGTALGASFSSSFFPYAGNAAGIGRLPDLPLFTIDVIVAPGVATGKKSTFTLDVTPAPWKDANGNIYAVTVLGGSVTVGGNLSISGVQPGGGILPAGTVVGVAGTGFDPAANLTVDGVSVRSTQVVSPQEIDFTVGAAAEMTGKRVAVTNPDGSQAEYFPWLPGVGSDGTIYVFPLRTGTFIPMGPVGDVIVQNPNLYPINVTEFDDTVGFGGIVENPTTVAPGQVIAVSGQGPNTEAVVSATGPMRDIGGFFDASPPSTNPLLTPLADLAAAAGSNWTLSRTVANLLPDPTPVTVSASAQSNGNWLSAPAGPVQSQRGESPLVITANPFGLAPGTYLGTVTETVTSTALPSVTGIASTVVRLDVASGGITEVSPNGVAVGASARPTPFQSQLPLDSNLFPSVFSMAETTDSGGNWLTATYDPAQKTIDLVGNQLGLPGPGFYTGELTITGSGNTEIVPVALDTSQPGPIITDAGSILTSVAQGPDGEANPSQILVNVTAPPPGLAVSTSAHSGGAWLSAALASSSSVSVAINASNLATGVYTGVVTLSSAGVAGLTQIAVFLQVLQDAQPQLIAVPSVISLSASSPAGPDSAGVELNVDSGYIPIPFQVQAITSDGGNWLTPQTPSGPTPDNFSVYVDTSNLSLGIYYGSILITSYSQSVSVPVTLNVTTPIGPVASPALGSITNAASAAIVGVSPGEIVTIYGTELGPVSPASLMLDANGEVSASLNGTSVLFGTTPAPLLYVSGAQINAVVPWNVAGPYATVLVQTVAGTSTPISIPVVPAVPGIFTTTGSGQGHASVLNEDNSVNSPSNPAARGSAIQIYGTGEGAVSPAATTGSVTQGAADSVLPVKVSIGGVAAQVLYAGSAPGEVSGVLQVNAIVPQQVTPGPTVPITLTVGTSSSPNRATISIK